MKRFALFLMIVCLVCGMMSGCIRGAGGEETAVTVVPGSDETVVDSTDPTKDIVEHEEITDMTIPFTEHEFETIPPKHEGGEYELPPGEKPTYDPQVS